MTLSHSFHIKYILSILLNGNKDIISYICLLLNNIIMKDTQTYFHNIQLNSLSIIKTSPSFITTEYINNKFSSNVNVLEWFIKHKIRKPSESIYNVENTQLVSGLLWNHDILKIPRVALLKSIQLLGGFSSKCDTDEYNFMISINREEYEFGIRELVEDEDNICIFDKIKYFNGLKTPHKCVLFDDYNDWYAGKIPHVVIPNYSS